MNKNIYILGLVGAALFSACSTSDDLSIGDSSAVDMAKESVLIYEAGQNSEVPITLGVGQSRGYTRAPLVTDVDEGYGNFSTEDKKYLGVFCLATGYQESYKDNPPIENNWTDDDDTGLNVWMKNVPAKVVRTEVTSGVYTSDVTFLDSVALSQETPEETPKSYFYPMSNWMKYNFYAYYPRQNVKINYPKLIDEGLKDNWKTILQFKNNRVLEKYYEIDGSQDIIWGRAEYAEIDDPEIATDADPYCANYFRFKGNTSEYYPQMKFQHKLVRFNFYVKAENSTVKNKIKQVRDMYINNGINYLELVVADKNNPENSGNLYWFGNSLKTERMYIKLDGTDKNRFHQDGDSPDHPLENISYENNVYVGYIMLAPPSLPGFNATFNNTDNTASDEEFVYKLKVRVKCKGSTSDFYPVYKLTPPDEGFQEGKTYKIVIIIKESDLV